MKHISAHSFTLLCITFLTLLCITFLSFTSFAQNTSPVNVIEFRKIPNGIMDEGKLDKKQIDDLDSNPVCEIKVKAQGFDETVMQRFVFVPRNIMITKTAFENNEWRIYVSSKKLGSLTIKYQGDCKFDLPYMLEPKKIYELVLGMETATLVIRATPEESVIYIDDEKVGTGNVSQAVSIGAEHRYRVECENYFEKEDVVLFQKSERKTIDIELEPAFGYITIGSTPSGAEVYIDEKKVGETPYQGKKIKRGQHMVEVRLAGYNSKVEMISVKAGDFNTQLQNIILEAVKVATGTLVLESNPAGAVVTINGRQYGQTPKTLTEFPVGTYTIYFTKDGYQNLSQNIELKDGGRETVSVTMSKTTVAQQPVPTGNSNAGGSATGNKINGHEYVDLGLPSSTLWATCNVGANSPEDYGNYYAWGETTTKSTYDWSTYKYCRGSYDNLTKYCTDSDYGTVDNKEVLEMTDDAARANWGGSWRMPTEAELEELKTKCTWTWTTQGGKNGYRVTGPNGKSIFLPTVGHRYDGSLINAGSNGTYWSSSLSTGISRSAYYLCFDSGLVSMGSYYRYYGRSVRPVSAPQN